MARKKKTLLVPIDGSDTALRALRHVLGRLRAGGFDDVVALNAQVPMRASQFVTQRMIEEHHESLSEEALVNFARKGDEIVMGTRGLGRVGNLLMGSVATRVVHLAEVPVTLVT